MKFGDSFNSSLHLTDPPPVPCHFLLGRVTCSDGLLCQMTLCFLASGASSGAPRRLRESLAVVTGGQNSWIKSCFFGILKVGEASNRKITFQLYSLHSYVQFGQFHNLDYFTCSTFEILLSRPGRVICIWALYFTTGFIYFRSWVGLYYKQGFVTSLNLLFFL